MSEPVSPKLKASEIVVVAGARFLSKLRPFIIIATFLVICLALYAVAWSFHWQ